MCIRDSHPDSEHLYGTGRELSESSTISPQSCSQSSQSTYSADEIRTAEKNVGVYFARFDYEADGVLKDREDVEMLITSLCVKLQLEVDLSEILSLIHI
eukprot:TRINITY_DN12877_c0_g2_i1.p1 TRINITY_DN12877_c0_g2~~TRINITY_DN12877_c0_g2_i1.p1  ORF type:complete len:114 (+),score=33.05 TRINITY_DN12877_c0_g2_i1:48-344(+)